MSTPRLNTIPTTKRGRPRTTRNAAAALIGPAIVDALAKADLYIVTGHVLRELALIVGEPAPQEPIQANEQQETTGLPAKGE